MNFLAHLHLACPNAESRMGNLLGDFVRGRPDDRFPASIWRGIMHHRHLDAFTDSHPRWKTGKRRLDPSRVRYAGIVVDVFFDHFLTRHWDRFSGGTDLETFIDGCHRHLREARRVAPFAARKAIERMEEQGWLASYGDLAGIDRAMRRISRRSPRLEPMKEAVLDLERDYEGFEADFLAFYPDAMARSEELHRMAEADLDQMKSGVFP